MTGFITCNITVYILTLRYFIHNKTRGTIRSNKTQNKTGARKLKGDENRKIWGEEQSSEFFSGAQNPSHYHIKGKSRKEKPEPTDISSGPESSNLKCECNGKITDSVVELALSCYVSVLSFCSSPVKNRK